MRGSRTPAVVRRGRAAASKFGSWPSSGEDPPMSMAGGDWIEPIANHFRDKGWARGVVAFDVETLDRIRIEIQTLWNERRAASRDAFATHRPELPRLHRVNPTLGAFVRHPVLVALATRII